MPRADPEDRRRLVRRGLWLEYVTLGWNLVGVPVLFASAVVARSGALVAFGLDSAIEIFASTVVIWELNGDPRPDRTRRATRLIGLAFLALAAYLTAQAVVTLAVGHRPHHSPVGMVWIALTAAVMFTLAAGKRRTGSELGNPVLLTEAKVTIIDGLLALQSWPGWLSTLSRLGGGPTLRPALSSSSMASRRAGTPFKRTEGLT